jgi:hypothetical protein
MKKLLATLALGLGLVFASGMTMAEDAPATPATAAAAAEAPAAAPAAAPAPVGLARKGEPSPPSSIDSLPDAAAIKKRMGALERATTRLADISRGLATVSVTSPS